MPELSQLPAEQSYGDFCDSLASMPNFAGIVADIREAIPHVQALVVIGVSLNEHLHGVGSIAPRAFAAPLLSASDCEAESRLLEKWNEHAPETFGAVGGNGQILRQIWAFLQAHPELSLENLIKYLPLILSFFA